MIHRAKPLALALLLVMLLALVLLLPLSEWLAAGIGWIDAHRTLSWGIFILSYTLAPVLLIPGSLLTLGAGFLFGLPVGVALVWVGSLSGASAAFFVGRFLARDWVAKTAAKTPAFAALDKATRHEGFVIVLLTRLSPLFPFNLLNYLLGLTAVRFRDYWLASSIGMLPGIVVYTYLGTAAKDVVELTGGNLRGGMADRALLAVGLLGTVVLTIFITRKATTLLHEHLRREGLGANES